MSKVENRLKEIEKQIIELTLKAEEVKNSDPETAMLKARKACETICREVCLKEGLIKADKAVNLQFMIDLIGQHDKAPRYIRDDMKTIQFKGNTSGHPQKTPMTQAKAALPALAALANVTEWYFSKYGSIRLSYNPNDPEFIKYFKKLLQNKIFKTAAIATISGTAVAILGSLFGVRKKS